MKYKTNVTFQSVNYKSYSQVLKGMHGICIAYDTYKEITHVEHQLNLEFTKGISYRTIMIGLWGANHKYLGGKWLHYNVI